MDNPPNGCDLCQRYCNRCHCCNSNTALRHLNVYKVPGVAMVGAADVTEGGGRPTAAEMLAVAMMESATVAAAGEDTVAGATGITKSLEHY